MAQKQTQDFNGENNMAITYKWNDQANTAVRVLDGGVLVQTVPVGHRIYREDILGNPIEAYKTSQEMEQDRIDKISQNKKDLKSACLSYEAYWIDRNMQSEFDLSRALYEGGNVTPSDLPKAAVVGAWKESLWADYYVRKTAIEAEQNFTLDFSNNDPLEVDFHDIRKEREDFLAGV